MPCIRRASILDLGGEIFGFGDEYLVGRWIGGSVDRWNTMRYKFGSRFFYDSVPRFQERRLPAATEDLETAGFDRNSDCIAAERLIGFSLHPCATPSPSGIDEVGNLDDDAGWLDLSFVIAS